MVAELSSVGVMKMVFLSEAEKCAVVGECGWHGLCVWRILIYSGS
jgi:hypothetical protein